MMFILLVSNLFMFQLYF